MVHRPRTGRGGSGSDRIFAGARAARPPPHGRAQFLQDAARSARRPLSPSAAHGAGG